MDQQHLRVIQTFVRDLPVDTPVDTVECRFLAEHAATLRSDQLEKVANRCAVLINPDGKFSDEDRACRRGFTWAARQPDGMSTGKLRRNRAPTSTPDWPDSLPRACATR
jgi:hypothetical protein